MTNPSGWEQPAGRARPRRPWLVVGAAAAIGLATAAVAAWLVLPGWDGAGELAVGEGGGGSGPRPTDAAGDAARPESAADPDARPDDARALAPVPDGGVWVGTGGAGLVRWERGGRHRRRLADELAGRPVVAVTVGGGAVWAAPEGSEGVVRLDGATATRHTADDGLADDDVRSLAPAEGGVWAGTRAGLSRFGEGGWRTVGGGEVLPHPRVASVATAPDGAAWVVTGTVPLGHLFGGVARYREGTWTTWSRREDFPYGRVTALAAGADGAVWAVARSMTASPGEPAARRLVRYDGTGWAAVDGGGLPERLEGRITSMAVDGRGAPWVGLRAPSDGAGGGVARFDAGEWLVHTAADGLPDDRVRAVAADDRVVWAATAGGVAAFADGAWTPYVIRER